MASKSDIIGVERLAIIDRAAPSGGFDGWTNQPTWNVALLLCRDMDFTEPSTFVDRISWDFVNWSEVAFSILDDVAETL